MPTINYRAEKFSSGDPLLAGWHTITPSWQDIVWAAVSVGKIGQGDILANGPFSKYEILWRVFMVYADLQQVGPNLIRSKAYDDLDPSEKAAVSFFLGMAFAKLAAEFLLDTPWLIHLDKIRRICPVVLDGRSRPDLVGWNSKNEWIAVEAKGRTNNYSKKVMESAKKQVDQIVSINGTAPKLKAASQMCFSPSMEIHLCDPNDNDDGYGLEINSLEFLKLYYEPFSRIPTESFRRRPIDNDPYDFVDFKDLGVSIGIHREIRKFTGNELSHPRFFDFERRIIAGDGVGHSATALYRDGLAIQLDKSWSEESMKLPPKKRLNGLSYKTS
jgi:hypothetical protein